MLRSTAVVRDRFQLTIPELVRIGADWVSPGSVVTVTQVGTDEIVIRPHGQKGKIDWSKLWRDIKRVRSYKGRGGGNLSAFIAQDRETRR